MELVQEFVNAADRKLITARVPRQNIRIDVDLIEAVVKLLTWLLLEPLIEADQPADYQALLFKYGAL